MAPRVVCPQGQTFAQWVSSLEKVWQHIGSSLSVPTDLLIRKLNPVLRGWAEYHKGVVAKATFSRLDHLIYWRLMKWGRRRHPRKSGKWVYDHYWPQLGSRRAMAVHLPDQNGDLRSLVLYQLADTKIVRHQKVDGNYNPFDPAWFAYAERLLTARMSQDIWDTQRLKLWMQQGGKCVLCEQFIDSTRAMDDHHIVYREYGGSHALSNRVLLHPVCHRRVHALGLEVTKPVPARGL